MTRTLLSLLLTGIVLVTVPPAPASTTSPGTTRAASAGQALERAQHRLNQLGCESGPADGRPDEHVRAALIRFQTRHRLTPSGRLTATTTRHLYAEDAHRCDVRPVPPGSGTGRRIVVSQRQNWVWLVASGGHVLAQSGMIDNPGVLHNGWKRVGSYCGRTARIRHNRDASGTLALEYFVRFAACGIGFHRIPLYRNGHQIHPDWLVGTNLRASHGCVRLPRPFAAKVWSFGGIGTRVRVVGG